MSLGYNGIEFTLKEYVDYNCFASWKNRGHCLDLHDFLDTIEYDFYYSEAELGDVGAFITVIEIIFNCWKMAELYGNNDEDVEFQEKFYLLYNIMDECLSHYNHKAVYIAEKEQMIVIEDKPEVTAVAEIVEPDLAVDILRYNHHSMRGNIVQKRAILRTLGADLEAKSKLLSSINNTFKDTIFFILNNLNIRHNNCNPADKSKYKEFVAKMDSSELEKWYDELYQMILLAFLELDQLERNPKIKELKTNVIGGTN